MHGFHTAPLGRESLSRTFTQDFILGYFRPSLREERRWPQSQSWVNQVEGTPGPSQLGIGEETNCRSLIYLTVEQTLNVTRSVNEMDDFNPVALGQIEDQPVLEAFHRPAAKTAKNGSLKGAQDAEFRHLRQRIECALCCVQKSLRRLLATMLFEICGVRQDIPASAGANQDLGHLRQPEPLAELGSACRIQHGACSRIPA